MKTAKQSAGQFCFLFLLALVNLPGSLYSDNIPVIDEHYSIQGWVLDDGLPRNTISSITQTPDGFIWLGSFFSLIRFDGIEFKEYGLEAGNQIYKIRNVAYNDEGELFLAPRNQLLKKFANGRFSDLSINEDSYHDFHCVTTAYDNTVWAIDGDGIVYKVVDDELLRMAVLKAEFQHDILFDLKVAPDGAIWFSRGEFYGYFYPGGQPRIWTIEGAFVRLSPSSDGTIYMLANNEIRKLIRDNPEKSEHVATLPIEGGWLNDFLVDSRNRIWIGIPDYGLFLWENEEFKRFETVPSRLRAIFEDKDGSIWIGSEGSGLYHIREKLFQVISNSDKPFDKHITSVHKNLYVPTSNGIFKLTDNNQSEEIDGLPNFFLSTVWAESDNNFWTGSNHGWLFHYDEGRIQEYQIDSSNQPVRLLFMDSKKNIWAGGFDWGLCILPYPYTTIERVLSDGDNRHCINTLVELPTGEIFAGSRSGSVFQIKEENIRHFGGESGLKGSSILSLLYTSTGHLLAGTSGHGLAVLDNGKFHYISIGQGLYDPIIAQMIEDDSGFLWIGSARGIFRIDLSDLEAWLNDRARIINCTVYGKAHGLSNIEAITDYQPGVSLTSDGIIEFATNQGVVRVNPEDIESSYSQPVAVIDSVQIDGLKLPGNNPVRVRSGFQRISLNYTAANFASPQSINYRCSLEGFDNDWIQMGKERSISYPKLPPGDYTFKISASDQNGVWTSTYANIPIIVVPRWWETLLARITFLALFTLAIGIIVRMILIRRMQIIIERTRQEMMLERERTRISKDLHDDLGARLTEIAFMADLAPKSAGVQSTRESAWNSIARRARKAVESLDQTVWMVDPGKDVLEQFVAYIVQYSTEFCERSDLACRLNISESIPSVKLEGRTRHHLFLAFKEALNNVVRHADATRVKIAISCESKNLKVSVSDNGKGLNLGEAESGQRHGIGNMRDRMERIGGKFEILSNPEDGTFITFTLTFNDKQWKKANRVL